MKHRAGLHPYGYKRTSMKSVCQRLKQYPRLFQSKPMSEVFLGSIENSSEVKNLRASWDQNKDASISEIIPCLYACVCTCSVQSRRMQGFALLSKYQRG